MKVKRPGAELTEIKVYGLLHLQEHEYSAVNLKVKSFADQIKVYLDNAALLSKSLETQEIQFILLTNDFEKLTSLKSEAHKNLKIEQISFPTKVPSGINFYSAHFKVDVFRYISKQNDDYLIFCDLDMVCLKPLPAVFKTIISEKIPLVYEITDQIIPANGHEAMIEELQIINNAPSEGRWIGGEFVSGTPEFFKKFVEKIDEILPIYFKNLQNRSISSLGNDEVYSTAAIEKLRRDNVYIGEAGLSNIVGRFWSSGTGHVQKTFEHFENMFMLHLPADKKFLSEFNLVNEIFDPNIFIGIYKKVLRNRKFKSSPRLFFYFIYSIKTKTPLLKKIEFEKTNNKI